MVVQTPVYLDDIYEYEAIFLVHVSLKFLALTVFDSRFNVQITSEIGAYLALSMILLHKCYTN